MVTNYNIQVIKPTTAESLYDIQLVSHEVSGGMTKEYLAKGYGLEEFGAFDYAIPLSWANDFRDRMHEEPSGYVWLYPRSDRIEFPFPLTDRYEKFLERYDGLWGTHYSRKSLKELGFTIVKTKA